MASKKERIESENAVFAERLKDLMKERGISQEQLGDTIGKSRQSISYYTQGQNLPDLYTVAEIAKFFDVSTDYLCGLSDVRSLDTDIRSICEYTGLTEKSINILHMNKGFTSVNELIENSENLFFLLHDLEFTTSIARKDYENIKIDLQDGIISTSKAHKAFSFALDFIEHYYYPMKERLESFANFYGTRELIFAIAESKAQIEREKNIIWIEYPRYKRYSSSDYSYSENEQDGEDNGKHQED